MSNTATFRDKSIASLAAGSQVALAANSSRSYLYIQNTGNANIGVNLSGGVAVIGGTGTVTLPFVGNTGGLDSDLEYALIVPNSAIAIIGTAGQPVTIYEV